MATNTFIIAEAGVNHNGSAELALRLIETAATAGADAIKFQTFNADKLVSRQAATAAYQKLNTGDTDQYSMLKKLELSEETHRALYQKSVELGIEFMSTPFDLEAARFLVELGMQVMKVPSGELTNLPFVRDLAAFNQPMILSTGMAAMEEVTEAVAAIREARSDHGFSEPLEQKLSILHCTSNYPTAVEDVNLRAMQTMAETFKLPVGYSDHTEGVLIAGCAVAMGASIIEKHFTLDRSMPGPDHQASLEPGELNAMVEQIRQIEKCLGDGHKRPRGNELEIRDLVRRSVTLTRDKQSGETLQPEDLQLLRPGTGIAPKDIGKVVGKRMKNSKNAGTTLDWQDIVE